MFAFGSAITKPDVFLRCARPGIDRVAEPDSVVLEHSSTGTLFEAYNALLDRAAQLPGLEALVLVHQDAELVSPDFCATVRRTLADPDVALVGCLAAVDVLSIAWWEGSVTWASHAQPYGDDGRMTYGFSWDPAEAPPYAQLGEVEAVDGFVLVCSPWLVQQVRFDEALRSRIHGYDLDLCLQVRAAGRKVVTADFRAVHHQRSYVFADREDWMAAHVAVAEKWEGRDPGLPGSPGGWRQRALLAEAQAAAAGAVGEEAVLRLQAQARDLERALAETKESLSWRITAPLRRWGRSR